MPQPKRKWKKKKTSSTMTFKEPLREYRNMMILGDLNAKIGKEKAYENVTGKHTLHEISNQNGELVCNFATENNLTVMSTQFQHKRIHKGTWTSPDFKTVNQIDHILINTNKKRIVQDIRTLRGLNCDSHHFLVKTILKQRLITNPRGNIDNRKKWNLDQRPKPTNSKAI